MASGAAMVDLSSDSGAGGVLRSATDNARGPTVEKRRYEDRLAKS
jgi:hypothetical protein